MPSFETIKECACWPEARLRERAQLWPDPLTWAWFLGERCEQYSQDEIRNEFLAVAYTYVRRARVRLPVKPADIWRARVAAELPVLLDFLASLGDYLDRWDLEGAAAADSDEYRLLEAATAELLK